MIRYALIGLLLVGMALGYALEFQVWLRSFGVWIYFAFGIPLGMFLGWLASKHFRQQASDGVEKFQVSALVMLPIALILPLLFSWSNRLFPRGEEVKKGIFWEEKPYFSSRYGLLKGEQPQPSGYYLFIKDREKLIRIRFDQPSGFGLNRGDSLDLVLEVGLWGVREAKME